MLILCLLTFLIVFTSSKTSLAYTKNYDQWDASVVYQCHHKVTKWSEVDDYRFVKHISKDGTASYWLAISTGDVERTIEFSGTAEMNIDGISYTLERRTDIDNRYVRAYYRFDSVTYYDISSDIINLIKNSKSNISIKFLFENRKPIVWALGDSKMKEFKNIIDLSR